MTQCSSLSFGFLGRRQVTGRFDGGRLSSDGGLLLLAEVDRRFGLTQRLASCLRDRRQQSKVRQSRLDLVRQRVYQIACGYEDCNDADTLAADPVLKLACGRNPEGGRDLASQPTLSRFENSVSPAELYRMSLALLDLFIEAHREPPREIVLDLDATDDPTHGQQELSFFHGYYDEYCYLPMLVFAQADGGPHQLLAAVLRPGNVHAGRGSVTLLKRIVARLREAWPEVRIVVRGDSGEALPEVYDWCEGEGQVDFVIGLARNSRLQGLGEPSLEAAREEFRETQAKVRHCHDLSYAADSWGHERRVVVKAEVSSKGDNPRFVVTSRDDLTAEELYDFYADRGDVENRIKELKNDLHADRTSCHRFVANQFRLLLHAAAYLLLTLLRGMLTGTELASAQAGTLRLRLVKVGVRVEQTARRVWLHLASSYPWAELWNLLARRLRAGPG
jgi:Transposase DDE domain group 1